MAYSRDIRSVGAYEVDLGKEIGRGNFGAVYMGEHYKTKEKVVAKKLFLDRLPDREYATSEVAILKLGVRHDNIVDILYDEDKGGEFWIIMEFCDQGNLSQYCRKNHMDLYRKVDIMYQCSDALVYLLNLKPERVIHRDLKPANILLCSMEDGGLLAKISDFGMSRAIASSTATQLGTMAGSSHFMAPEMFGDGTYTRAVDVFALGIIIHYLIKVCKS